MTVMEAKKKYDSLKEKFGIKADFEILDKEFMITDLIEEKGFISTDFIRQIISRQIDYLAKWNEFFHRILVPSPGSIVVSEESKALEEDKEKINEYFNKIMSLISKNSYLSMLGDEKENAKFLDEVLDFWLSFKDQGKEYLKKTHEMWSQRKQAKNERPNYSG